MSAPLVSQSVAEDLAWLKRDAIIQCAEILESLAISLREAAWRGSDVTIETTLLQQRETLIEAIQIHKGVEAPRERAEAAE